MLAVMSSFALTGLHSRPLDPSSIAFYAAAATVIPVLFLALVQGKAIENLLGVGEVPASLRLTVAGVILLAGSAAEATALIELSVGTDIPFNRWYVFAAVMVLVLAVASTPMMKLFELIAAAGSGSTGTEPRDAAEQGQHS
jgi:hypothetical protein